MHAWPDNVVVRPDLTGRIGVFDDRREAGEVLADMLAPLAAERPLVLGIPAGGVPVAAEIARRLEAPLSVLVTSKATPPWNSEIGFGAVAFDGTEYVDAEAAERLGLSEAQVRQALERAREKVRRRQRRFLGGVGPPDVRGRPIILVDDGLATGKTAEVAIRALRKQGAGRVILAVPTCHDQALRRLAPQVDALYCANVRSGFLYAVADAYRHWHDVTEEEVERHLAQAQASHQASHEEPESSH